MATMMTEAEQADDAAMRGGYTWHDEIVNLTANPVRLLMQDGTVLAEWAGAAEPARVRMQYVQSGTVGSIPLHREVPTEEGVRGLPAPVSGRYLIVSRVVAAAALLMDPERNDLLVPGQPKREGSRTLGTFQLVRV
jgi:hypothetical protein